MKLEFIERLIDIAERNQLSELEYSDADNRVRFRLAGAGAAGARAVHPAPPPQQTLSVADVAAQAPARTAADAAGHTIASPLVGIFYRAQAPDKPPFVALGDRIEEGQTLAIVEAMKMLNPIEADRNGRLLAIIPEDGAAVDFGSPLFIIEEEL